MITEIEEEEPTGFIRFEKFERMMSRILLENQYPRAGRDGGRPRQRQRPTATPATATAQGGPPSPGQRPQPLRSHEPCSPAMALPRLRTRPNPLTGIFCVFEHTPGRPFQGALLLLPLTLTLTLP